MSKQRATNSVAFFLRWIARIGSVVSAVFLLAFVFGGNERLPQQEEWLQLAFFPGGVLLGMAIGWKNEVVGGAITVLSLLAFLAMQLIQAGNLPSGPWFFIFASPGILFLITWFTEKFSDQSSSVASG